MSAPMAFAAAPAISVILTNSSGLIPKAMLIPACSIAAISVNNPPEASLTSFSNKLHSVPCCFNRLLTANVCCSILANCLTVVEPNLTMPPMANPAATPPANLRKVPSRSLAPLPIFLNCLEALSFVLTTMDSFLSAILFLFFRFLYNHNDRIQNIKRQHQRYGLIHNPTRARQDTIRLIPCLACTPAFIINIHNIHGISSKQFKRTSFYNSHFRQLLPITLDIPFTTPRLF